MPIHDWTGVYSGLFHHFHQRWISALSDDLNSGGLPSGYFALAEQYAGERVPDVLTLHNPDFGDDYADSERAGVALLTAPPRTKFISHADDADTYVQKANRIVVYHRSGGVVAVIEIVSPGNKHSRAAMEEFVDKAIQYLRQGVHLLIVDLFPPTPRDPNGIHPLIWDTFRETQFELPIERPLTLMSYAAGSEKTAYVEPVAIGDDLTAMPLFLSAKHYVPAPLQPTYDLTWNVCPRPLRDAVLNPKHH